MYKFDVFISYRRDPYQDEWLIRHFVPMFSAMVRNAIAAETNRAPEGIFFDQAALSTETRKFDQHGIEPGEEWRKELMTAIRHSRCMLALWSPLYFHSSWCTAEWQSFAARGQSAGQALFVPISVYDGHKFPSDAQKFQFLDFSDYVIAGSGYEKTERYVTFQVELRQLAQRVGKVVASAPAFQPWAVVEPETITTTLSIKQPLM